MANNSSHRAQASKRGRDLAKVRSLFPAAPEHVTPQPGRDCPHCVQQMAIGRDVAAGFAPRWAGGIKYNDKTPLLGGDAA